MSLFSSCRFFGLNLRNRLVRSATAERAAGPDGRVTADYAAIHGQLAAGGIGLIITGHAFVEPAGANGQTMTGIHDDAVIPGLQKSVEAAHARGSKIVLQISHCGRQTSFSPDNTPPPAPSAVSAPGSLAPREMTESEIQAMIAKFISAAVRARKAGFDGVELHGAHGYLISQFVSPYTNRRTDAWGGSYENRLRFVKEIILGIKKACPGFPLLIKWNSEDFVDAGLTQEESARMVLDMEAAGLDGVEVSGGIFESAAKICRRHIKEEKDEGYFAGFASLLKNSGLKIPVILVGGFRTAAVMEKCLQEGIADLIALCRPLVRDSAFPLKLMQNPLLRSDCISCNACLMSREAPTRCRKK